MRRTRKIKYRKLRRTYRKQRGGGYTTTLKACPLPFIKKQPGGILRQMFAPCDSGVLKPEEIKELKEGIKATLRNKAIKKLVKRGFSKEKMTEDAETKDAGEELIQEVANHLFIKSIQGKTFYKDPGCRRIKRTDDDLKDFSDDTKDEPSGRTGKAPFKAPLKLSRPSSQKASKTPSSRSATGRSATGRSGGGFSVKKRIKLNSSKNKNKV